MIFKFIKRNFSHETGENKFSPVCVLFILTVSILFTPPTNANMLETYGLGSRSSALGAVTSWGFDGFAAAMNPAAVSLATEKRVLISVGGLYSQVSFKPINDVVVDNEYVSDKTGPVKGNVSVDEYKPTTGTSIGVAIRLFPKFLNLAAGVSAYVPLQHLAYMDTSEPYIPEYILYKARTQRPQVATAIAFEPYTGLLVGAGLNTAFTLTSKADVFIQSSSSKPSSMKFAATLKPKFIPQFGLMYVSKKNDRRQGDSAYTETEAGAYTASFVIRLEGKSETDITLNSNAAFLNPLPALPFQFEALSAVYYDPLTLEFGSSFAYTRRTRFIAQLDYQFWGDFDAPGLTVTPQSGVNMSKGGVPAFYSRNIIVPKFGHEWLIGKNNIIRFGYSYRQSIFKDPPNGAGNYLDPGRDIFTFGLGHQFEKILDWQQAWNLDLHFAYHSLRSQDVVKTAGNELGTGAYAGKIGAPGYEADGSLWALGLSASLAL